MRSLAIKAVWGSHDAMVRAFVLVTLACVQAYFREDSICYENFFMFGLLTCETCVPLSML
ncbi:conserved hypothetical protein [Trichinella spiralis]|uniref:hypothetical protein n=1 Tax=Trichinella spiralis TaxID=6334 RepID=UPI0001EFD972|nr:conserved hypothetical protein [Trichinella spiralis]